MNLLERLRERHKQARDRREKGAAWWWVVLQIVSLLWQLWQLTRRGGK